MQLLIYISTIFIAALLPQIKNFSLPVNISGHLRDNPAYASIKTDSVLVLVKSDNKILAKALTDKRGNFKMTFTPGHEKSFDFYCTDFGADTVLIASVPSFESDTPEMTFYLPIKVKRNILGRVICPICKREDKVFRVRHSDAPVFSYKITNSGRDTTYTPIYKGKYQAGCLGGLASYYCDRDKVKF